MLRTPTELELQHLMADYDPRKAHDYYEKHKKLKGRKPGRITEDDPRWNPKTMGNKRGRLPSSIDPRTGKTIEEIQQNAKAKQKKELAASIQSLDKKLQRLEAKIRELRHEAAQEDRKSKAKKERASKEREKPKTAAEKAKAARESEKYRDKHKQELKSKAKKDSDKAGSDKKKSGSNSEKISELKTIATRVKGQIAVAKQKLAAL
jgi:hypothetical protein